MIDIKGVKITENNSDGSIYSPNYIISYDKKKPRGAKTGKNFEIITKLKGNDKIVIEMNSSLFMLPDGKREIIALEFIKQVKELGLEYRYKTSPSLSKRSFFAQLFGMGSKDAHDLLVYVSDEMWANEDFKASIPADGIRYYVFDGQADSTEIINKLFNGQMLDDEKIGYFKYMIFDCNTFGQMGVISRQVAIEDARKNLGL